jgi:hypothetical protein
VRRTLGLFMFPHRRDSDFTNANRYV